MAFVLMSEHELRTSTNQNSLPGKFFLFVNKTHVLRCTNISIRFLIICLPSDGSIAQAKDSILITKPTNSVISNFQVSNFSEAMRIDVLFWYVAKYNQSEYLDLFCQQTHVAISTCHTCISCVEGTTLRCTQCNHWIQVCGVTQWWRLAYTMVRVKREITFILGKPPD